MAHRQIRDAVGHPGLTVPRWVTVLPPREGFSPAAVGAIGLLVHRTGAPGDVVLGEAGGCGAPFPDRVFLPVAPPWHPWRGRAARYGHGVLRALRRLRPTLVEVHNRADVALALARARPGSRVALFVHNDPQAMRGARHPADRAALLRALTVVCVSRFLHDRFMAGLEGCGLPPPRVLPNAIDLAAMPPPVPFMSRQREILFVGRTVADKGAEIFVDACATALPALPGWRAALIGADRFWPRAATTPFERALRPRADAAGIAWRGYQPHAVVLDALSRAAIVAVPSRWPEPFGMVALEAAASGAALVCSLRGGLPEVVGEAALAVDPDAPGALAAALLRLAGDATLRARLATAALARARLFDAPRARARLQSLREELTVSPLPARERVA